MYKKLLYVLAVSSAIVGAPISAQESIEITQKSSGRSIPVEIISTDEKNVTVRLKSGKSHILPLNSLTEESVKKIHASINAKEAVNAQAFLAVNKLIGGDVFSKSHSLWSEPVQQVAQRLKLTQESTVKEMLSYRLYTQGEASFLGAHPYCITLYGDPKGKAEQLSLVFANKGDYGSKFGMGRDHFKKVYADKEPPQSLEKAIELDAKTITSSLTKKFGEPKTQYFGEKADRRKVKRWDWRNHAFVLSEKDEEYVSLAIIPTTVADSQGKVKRINDSEMKKLKIKNALKTTNGDVRITNIPMVDQGPKGYCVPATMERAMRYMGVPADMYLLAVSATDPETGTDTEILKENSERIVRSKGRRFKTVGLDGEIKLKEVKKHIDDGVPILWNMRSADQYNDIATQRTKKRAQVVDFAAWASEIQKEADAVVPQLKKVEENYHTCMIIGYNEKTNEIAVSDSWGPDYELRWIHIDIASAVTDTGSFVLSF